MCASVRQKMTRRIDLHVHSSASDGVYSPIELVDLARKRGVEALAITDHDTVGGLAQAVGYARETGYTLVPGIEFSVEHPRGSFHLVGLYVDHENAELQAASERLRSLRDSRGTRMIADLRSHGVDITLEEVLAEAGGAPLGKPHFARVMVRHGFGRDLDDIFRRYLADGRPGDIKKERIPAAEAISLIRNAGGIPIVAHPVSLECRSPEEFEDLLRRLIDLGLEGVEAYASMHTHEQALEFAETAGRYGLLVSGGSDFHGDRPEEIGTYNGGRLIPAGLFDAMRRFHEERG